MRKDGEAFALPMALAFSAPMVRDSRDRLMRYLVVGELALRRPRKGIKGALPARSGAIREQ